MTRLLIHVEGETEESFVKEVLGPYLMDHEFTSVSARLVGNSRNRSKRGGVKIWRGVRKEIINHLRQDRGCVVSTMVDYYGLPRSGPKEWPGRSHASCLPYPQSPEFVESEILRDVYKHLGQKDNPQRFVPFVTMHEFEALLFSDCSIFARSVGASVVPGRRRPAYPTFRFRSLSRNSSRNAFSDASSRLAR